MSYLSGLKKMQATWKLTTKTLPARAKVAGLIRGKVHPFALPVDQSELNLYQGIRDNAIKYWNNNDIQFHGAALPGKPTNHLCSSQILCINVFFPFMDRPEALRDLLLPWFPDIEAMLPFGDGRFLEFESIGGVHNYLGEEGHLANRRRRGAGNTSIDVVAQYRAIDGQVVRLLIETKFTENYALTYMRFRSDGSDRGLTYAPLYFADHSPFRTDLCPTLDAFWFEPIYQMLRHTLMASETVHQKLEPIDRVHVVECYVAANKELLKVRSQFLRQFGSTTLEVWHSILKDPDMLVPITMEDLIAQPIESHHPELIPWKAYLRDRYRGVFR